MGIPSSIGLGVVVLGENTAHSKKKINVINNMKNLIVGQIVGLVDLYLAQKVLVTGS